MELRLAMHNAPWVPPGLYRNPKDGVVYGLGLGECGKPGRRTPHKPAWCAAVDHPY